MHVALQLCARGILRQIEHLYIRLHATVLHRQILRRSPRPAQRPYRNRHQHPDILHANTPQFPTKKHAPLYPRATCRINYDLRARRFRLFFLPVPFGGIYHSTEMSSKRRKPSIAVMPKARRKPVAQEEPSAAKERKGDRNESQTVLRACEVLKTFHSLGEELNLAQVIERTGLPKTTVFRLLRTLIHGGLLERAGSGVYRNRFGPVTARPFRIGFAAQGDSDFCREVMKSMEVAAAREHVHLITVNNRYWAREALRNADLLIKEQVDLVIEYQTYERIAPVISSKFLEASTPVIAIEVPHPGATYFGANNYKAGIIGGKALGRWTRDNWGGKVDQLILLELPIAGSLLELRITGFVDGLRAELPQIASVPVTHLNGRG